MKYLKENTIIEISLKGETISILRDTNDKGQVSHVIKVIIPPGLTYKPLHFHDNIWEEIECLEGKINIICGKRKRSLLPGESIFIHKYTPHSYSNPSDTSAELIIRVEKPEEYLQSFRILKNLQENNALDKDGTPKSIFHKVYINRLQNKRLPLIPLPLQKITSSTIFKLGKTFNFYKDLE